LNIIQTDDIIDILTSDGFVDKDEVIGTKIRITDEGKERVKNNQT
jgi:hypothetical protein